MLPRSSRTSDDPKIDIADDADQPKKRRRGKRGGRRHRRKDDPGAAEAVPAGSTETAASAESIGRAARIANAESGEMVRDVEGVDLEDMLELDGALTGNSVRDAGTDRNGDGRDMLPETRERFEISMNPREDGVARKQEMLINAADSDECRIAIVKEGRLEELYLERAASASHVGNIYKGRVTNVEPSIQAAFVDFGLAGHGFLHISDVHPEYFPDNRENELVGRKTPRRERPPIQRCLRRGQEVIVQITKEGIGTKGPTLTTYLSIPGRFLVLMPGMEQLGVSRKVEDDDARRKARATLAQLKHPGDMGFIVRTAGIGRNKRELEQDMDYLLRLWRVVQRRIKAHRAPCELYQESDLVIRTVRDVYSADIERIVVDEERTARKVAEFLAIANPDGTDRVVHYKGSDPLFHLYGIEAEIESLHSRNVPLRCGGSIVIEPTEALVAIDVNSGRFRVQNDAEETALRVNLEAAEEITRQLRLRDLGGLIICDFIDMMQDRNRRKVERVLTNALKDHKERAKILRMSQFGIIEMTRQRQGPSISRSMFRDCPHCAGRGLVKSVESVTLDVLRVAQLMAYREDVASIEVRVSPPVAAFLLNQKRRSITDLEALTNRTIVVTAVDSYGLDRVEYFCTDSRGRENPVSFAPHDNARGRDTGRGGRGDQRGRGPAAGEDRKPDARGGERRDGRPPQRDARDSRDDGRKESRGDRRDRREVAATDAPRRDETKPAAESPGRDDAGRDGRQGRSDRSDRSDRADRQGRREERVEVRAEKSAKSQPAALPAGDAVGFTAGLELDFDEIETTPEPPLMATPDSSYAPVAPPAESVGQFAGGLLDEFEDDDGDDDLMVDESAEPALESKSSRSAAPRLVAGRTAISTGDRSHAARSFLDGLELDEGDAGGVGTGADAKSKKKRKGKAAATAKTARAGGKTKKKASRQKAAGADATSASTKAAPRAKKKRASRKKGSGASDASA